MGRRVRVRVYDARRLECLETAKLLRKTRNRYRVGHRSDSICVGIQWTLSRICCNSNKFTE